MHLAERRAQHATPPHRAEEEVVGQVVVVEDHVGRHVRQDPLDLAETEQEVAVHPVAVRAAIGASCFCALVRILLAISSARLARVSLSAYRCSGMRFG